MWRRVGHAFQSGSMRFNQGMCVVVKKGMCGKGGMHAVETANEAGGAHPTGMHSCFSSFLFFLNFKFLRFVLLYSFSPSFFHSSIIIAGSFRVSLFIDLGMVRTRFGETLGNHFYRPQTKLQKDNVFTSVCQEFCPHGGKVCAPTWVYILPGQTPPGRYLPPSDTPPKQTQPTLGRHPLRQTPSPSQLTPPSQSDGHYTGQHGQYGT